MLCSLKRLRIVIYFAVKEAPGYPARPPDARSCEARRAKVAASASVLTGFPSPLGQGAFSGRKGRTSCCRGELRLPGLVLGARSLPGRNEGGDGPESRGDPQPPAAPGPAVERSRALQPNLFPEVEGPPGGSAPEQPHGDPRPGVAEITRAARGGQASPFFRLLADAPDIVEAQAGLASRSAGDSGSRSSFSSLPPFSRVRTRGGGQLRLGWVPRNLRCRVTPTAAAPSLCEEDRAAPAARTPRGKSPRDAHPSLAFLVLWGLHLKPCSWWWCQSASCWPKDAFATRCTTETLRAIARPLTIVVPRPPSTRAHF